MKPGHWLLDVRPGDAAVNRLGLNPVAAASRLRSPPPGSNSARFRLSPHPPHPASTMSERIWVTDPSEEVKIRMGTSEPASWEPKTVPQLFNETASRFADRPALFLKRATVSALLRFRGVVPPRSAVPVARIRR